MSSSSGVFSIFEHDKNFREVMHRLLKSSIEMSFSGVMITAAAPGYPIVYVNPAFCQMTGYAAEELLGQSPAVLQGPGTDLQVLAQLKQDLAAGRQFHGSAINYRKDGSEFMMEWKIAPIRNAQGQVSHYLAVQKDISHEQAPAD